MFNKRNRILAGLMAVLALTIFLTSCNNAENSSTDSAGGNSSKAAETGSDSDKSYLDIINKVEYGDSLDKINKAVGSEGKVKSDGQTYDWTFGRGGLTVIFKKGDTSEALSITLNYKNEDVANSKVVIKDLDSLKAKVKNGISYSDFKELLGGVDGILVSKSSVTKGYVWRSPNGSVVDASFNSDNICNSFTGTEK